MKAVDKIKDSSFMVLSELSFLFGYNASGLRAIYVYNLKNIKQYAIFNIMNDGRVLLGDSKMSEVNNYKAIAIIERNKRRLLEGYIQWENTQRNA